jgi:feruloyl esterase
MIMAQRFPQLFDGIVSGAPAMRTTVSNLALRWISNQYAQVEGVNARDPFTDDEENLIMGALMSTCDALDGQEDGLIFNRTACDFDPRELACSANAGAASGSAGSASGRAAGAAAAGAASASGSAGSPSAGLQCLADEKAEALARAMAGPVTAGGKPVYVSYPWDSGIDDTGGLPGLLVAGGSPPVGQNGADLEKQDVDAEFLDAIASNEALGSTGSIYNVSTFIDRGGKHIFYHGEADPWFSANDTVRYFEQLGAVNDSVAPVEDYGRLYLVPGMAHCGGGEQTVDMFDLLTPIVEWVENGDAPDSVTATGASMPGQSRPLCPFPAYAHYTGGDAAAAASYECRMP